MTGFVTFRLSSATRAPLRGTVLKPTSTVRRWPSCRQNSTPPVWPGCAPLTLTPAGRSHTSRAARTVRGALIVTGMRVSPRISPTGNVGASDSAGRSCTVRRYSLLRVESVESVTSTVKVYVPVLFGVPLRFRPLRVRPGGRVPPASRAVYGPAPPAGVRVAA